MQIEYFGHACFRITTESGIKIVTDPYTKIGYELPKGLTADVVTVSHGHFDHNYVEGILGDFEVVSKLEKKVFGDVSIEGISTFHDLVDGKLRGKNTVYKITADGLTVCHLGDIGEPCNKERAKQIGKVDVLLIPIGGNYTIDAKTAWEYVRAIAPNTVIPMHFQAFGCAIDIAPEYDFLRGVSYVTHKNSYVPNIEKGETKIVFMTRKECL